MVYLEDTNEYLKIRAQGQSCVRKKVKKTGESFIKFQLNRTGFLSPEQRLECSRQGESELGFVVPKSTYEAKTKLYSPRQDKFDGYA